MATVETISAWENVCRDFGMLISVVRPMSAAMLPVFVDALPALALIFAIYSFYSQRENDRKTELRQVKRELYVKTLQQLRISYRDVPSEDGWENDPRFLRLLDFETEVELLRESVDLSPHIKKAIGAIKSKNDPSRRGMHDPHGAGGLACWDDNRSYTGEHWPFNRDVFEKAIEHLATRMREDLDS